MHILMGMYAGMWCLAHDIITQVKAIGVLVCSLNGCASVGSITLRITLEFFN